MTINDYDFDTIAAIATPFGMGSIGVVRISGNRAFDIINQISSQKIDTPNKIYHCWIVDENKNFVDEVVILPFKAPKSYTGEDVIEINCHGGMANVKNILDIVFKTGARCAKRGEFTQRAFLNKKLDLTQAESVLDIIHSNTSTFAKKSATNLHGKLLIEVQNIKNELLELLSKIVASIDFPEDVEEMPYNQIENVLSDIIIKIKKILSQANESNILRQGIKVALLGAVNVGKSSLFNKLLNLNRAIVTNIPGTTRDVIQENITINDLNINLSDTAGLRDINLADEVEKIGINLSNDEVDNANLVLFVCDLTVNVSDEDIKTYQKIKEKPHIIVFSKTDLVEEKEPDNIIKAKLSKLKAENENNYVAISTKNDINIDKLKNMIFKTVTEKLNSFDELEYVTNIRQQNCFYEALKSLKLAKEGTQNQELQDLISIDIKGALLKLEEITGENINEDVLNNIFEKFCIGK